jgi:hypothetical protein
MTVIFTHQSPFFNNTKNYVNHAMLKIEWSKIILTQQNLSEINCIFPTKMFGYTIVDIKFIIQIK